MNTPRLQTIRIGFDALHQRLNERRALRTSLPAGRQPLEERHKHRRNLAVAANVPRQQSRPALRQQRGQIAWQTLPLHRQIVVRPEQLLRRQIDGIGDGRPVQHTMHIFAHETRVRLDLQHRQHDVLPDAQSGGHVAEAALADGPQQTQSNRRTILVRVAQYRRLGETLDAHRRPLDGDQLQEDFVTDARQILRLVNGQRGERLVEEVVHVGDARIAERFVDERFQGGRNDVAGIVGRFADERRIGVDVEATVEVRNDLMK